MKILRQKKNGAAPKQAMSNSSGNGNGRGLAGARGATGPRTVAGKQRSSRNAIKHGIFSVSFLHGVEDAKSYRFLLTGLDEDFHPEGMLALVMVEKLATNLWRQRRLLQVESAEILEKLSEMKATLEDAATDGQAQFDWYKASTDRNGLILEVGESDYALDHCLDLLRGVRMELPKFGFERDQYFIPLARVYGARYDGRPGKDLYDFFLNCEEAAGASEEERKKRGFASEQDCLEKLLARLEEEICRLEGLRRKSNTKQRVSRELKLTDRRLLASMIPNASELDLLIRYGASLDRSFARTLNQLVDLQRMRLGHPVLPKLEVRHSLS